MTARLIRFHFDYVSPYSYLAWHRLGGLADRYDLRIELKPTLLAALLDHFGHKGPGEIAPKRIYIFKDCIRSAAAWNIPISPPFSHPFNPLSCLRATLLEMDEVTRKRLVGRLFSGVWAEGLDMGSAHVVARLCEELGIPDALKRIGDPAVKQLLHAASREAIELGVFGVPTMIVDGEPFWGTDSFGHLERHLRGDDPVRPEDVVRWQAVPATAHRRPVR